jgi:hypothetical protein
MVYSPISDRDREKLLINYLFIILGSLSNLAGGLLSKSGVVEIKIFRNCRDGLVKTD